MAPKKVYWHNKFGETDVKDAFYYFLPPNVTGDLVNLMNFVRGLAEEESSVPLIIGGLQSAQVGSSATGDAILQEQSTTVLDHKNEAWDDQITTRVLGWMIDWNWQYNDDETIRGDFSLDVRSSSEYRSSMMQAAKLEKLSIEAAQNPQMAEFLNIDELYRARLVGMGLPDGPIVRTTEQIAEARQAAQENQQPDPEQIKLQLEAQKLELENQKLQIEAQRMAMESEARQIELQLKMQTEQIQAEAKMMQAQADLMKMEQQREIALLTLAQQDEQHRSTIMQKVMQSQLTEETKRLMKGMDAQAEIRKDKLALMEMEIAKKQNKGGTSSRI
jgi:hypothetical protein